MSAAKQAPSPSGMLGVLPSGQGNTVAVLTSENAMECLLAGEAVIPCSIDECRALWGQQVMPAIDLRAAIAKATGSAL